MAPPLPPTWKGKTFFSAPKSQDPSEAHKASSWIGTNDTFFSGKRPGPHHLYLMPR